MIARTGASSFSSSAIASSPRLPQVSEEDRLGIVETVKHIDHSSNPLFRKMLMTSEFARSAPGSLSHVNVLVDKSIGVFEHRFRFPTS
jgi:hypothetical protein